MVPRSSRVALPLAAAILGFLAVLAAAQPRTVPGRETRRLEMVDLISAQDARVRERLAEVRELQARLEALRRSTGGADEVLAAAREFEAAAGATDLRGPGVTVTLDDSPSSRSPSGDPNDLVIHEQDIQAVVNALWAGGAEAVSIDGERLTATSAVRCAGNTLLLHGEVHSPPYLVRAIGDQASLAAGIWGQPGIGRLVERSRTFGIRFGVEPGAVAIPARSGPGLTMAVPVR
ncbi:MAG TPA: DUF881 domain-containing protein [Actinomycetota bacterium]|nr:DUF881 domain-containing protein [Actinomycetota bacterium]